jgi:superfamily I DNA/RNA helicase
MASVKEKPLTKQQREELARFVEKINNTVPSPHQEIIFERARSQRGRYVVIAGPGVGKTWTSIKASTFFEDRALFLAFNRKVKRDTKEKLKAIKSKSTSSTLHSFGLACLQTFKEGQCRVDDEKYERIAGQFIRELWDRFFGTLDLEDVPVERWPTPTEAKDSIVKLVHFTQMTLSQPDESSLLSLIDQFDLDDVNPSSMIWPFVCRGVEYAILEGIRLFHDDASLVSYDDMLYFPNIIPEVPVRVYRHIILDEAQDTSKAGLGLLLRACTDETQVFAVGDPKQSINVFAGADQNSIDNIIQALGAEILSLPLCYRCGTSIIELANQLGGNIIPASDRPGVVDVVNYEEYLEALQAGDVVLGRTTAPLVEDCLKILQSGRRAMVLGRDLGKSIAAVVSRLQEMRISRGKSALKPDLSNFADVLETYTENQKQEIEQRKNLKNKDYALSNLLDKVETVKCFFLAYFSKCLDDSLIVENDPKCRFNRTADDFKLYIKGLFVDDEDSSSLILYMTVHRAKGGEWKRVYIIRPDEFPHPKAKSDKQLEQEENVMYVALTRAIDEVHFVGKPFSRLKVPGYEVPAEHGGLTIISAPGLGVAEVHYGSHVDVLVDEDDEQADFVESEVVSSSIVEEVPSPVPAAPLTDEHLLSITQPLHEGDTVLLEGNEAVTLGKQEPLSPVSETPLTDEQIYTYLLSTAQSERAALARPAGRVSKALAIEVLCSDCGSPCVDPTSQSMMICEELAGKLVRCSSCGSENIVPEDAFTEQVIVVKRPISNLKANKVGRTPKERKSTAGRKTKSRRGAVRQPRQLSLDVRTIASLDVMSVNNSELFEQLLAQYSPFVHAWTEAGYSPEELRDLVQEIDHDEMREQQDD